MFGNDGNDADFLEIFHKLKDPIYDYALRMLGNSNAAGDIAQEVFLRLYKKRGDIEKIVNVRNWSFTIARNLCLNAIRDQNKEISLDNNSENISVETDFQDPKYRILKKAMLSLDSRCREALILKEYHGFSYKEIAEILKISIPAVRSLLYNARSRLRENFHKINNGRLLK